VLYSSCTFNKHIPIGISISEAGIEAIVSLGKHEGRDFVEVRLDVPAGKTIVLQENSIRLETTVPQSSSRAEFPLVSLVDTPIVNNYSAVPGIQQQHLPITAPLVGGQLVVGGVSYIRHFWLATYVQIGSAKEVWLTLPRFTVDSVPTAFSQIHFQRQTVVAVAVINC
jgi:hypothetical protein